MKYLLLLCAFLVAGAHAETVERLNQNVWNHGSENCEENQDPAIEIFQFDSDTYILRQNKCLDFEAPFIYVLFGNRKVFVQDTGATAEADRFPLYDTLRQLITERKEAKGKGSEALEILVTHSHSHSDHTAADPQFAGKPGVTLVAPDAESVRQYFAFGDWPNGSATIDLGGRKLTVVPTPGHHSEAITVYDPRTQWLLTGDTFYPGRLYIWDWEDYKASIRRLVAFTRDHEVSAILGTHIEMSRTPGEDYPLGSSYQPDEAGLALSVVDLEALDETLREMGAEPRRRILDKFIVYPVGKFQKALSWILKKVGL